MFKVTSVWTRKHARLITTIWICYF